MTMHPALLYERLAEHEVECHACAHRCRLKPGRTGPCRVQHNVAGALLTSSYGHPVALAIEPIEKKYLFHAFPGRTTLSLGTRGCNLGCKYCINWRVSQSDAGPGGTMVSPADIIARARAGGAHCIAFTYTEPTIFLEYALDIAGLARRAGLAVVAKSNGYMTTAALRALAPGLDAINIDLKGWRSAAHRNVVGGSVEPVLATLRRARHLGLWVEVTTLIVPGLSDEPADLANIAQFIVAELGDDTPWHVLRFFPHYRMADMPPTPQDALRRAVAIGHGAGLKHVYCPDLVREQGLDTFCAGCGTMAIHREHPGSPRNHLHQGGCRQCGESLAGVGLKGQRHLR